MLTQERFIYNLVDMVKTVTGSVEKPFRYISMYIHVELKILLLVF